MSTQTVFLLFDTSSGAPDLIGVYTSLEAAQAEALRLEQDYNGDDSSPVWIAYDAHKSGPTWATDEIEPNWTIQARRVLAE